ncbi:MAG: hypothetical protein HEQ11_14050 [Gemmatimonas sp.]|jgi:uncharacterized protein YidB (DUF937 family)|nr:hypothetical protein [Gemmatimonas sp.]
MLPEIVNQRTPGGQLPANSGALIRSLLGLIRGRLPAASMHRAVPV